jgi:serine/threonine protein kinase
MAPELLTVGGYTEKIDVWAYGIILYEMVTGIAPFLNLNYAGLYRELIEKRELPSIPSTCPRVLREIIRKCWSFDPVRRPSFAEIYQTLQRELANTK